MPLPLRKIVGLDAVRGFAALVVFTGHFFEGLGPAVTLKAAGTPFAPLFNGPAAVVLFFVLSGFVLTIRPLASRRFTDLVVLVVKRWPRLAGTVVVASFCYIVVASSGGFPSSSFLQHLQGQTPGYRMPPYVGWGQALQDTELGHVLAEASIGTFLYGGAQHNPVLWTMHWELLGSLLSACLACVVLLPVSRIGRAGMFVLVGIAGAAYSPWLMPFPLGVAGALLHLKIGRRIRLRTPAAIAMIVGAALLWSWDIRVTTGLWHWTNGMAFGTQYFWVALQSVAASCCMAVALYFPSAERVLGGRAGMLAGRLSFPLYLMHLLVMLSFSSWIDVLVVPLGSNQGVIGALFIVTFGVTLAVSMPLAMFDGWWVRQLGRAARLMFPVPNAPGTGTTYARPLDATHGPEPHRELSSKPSIT